MDRAAPDCVLLYIPMRQMLTLWKVLCAVLRLGVIAFLSVGAKMDLRKCLCVEMGKIMNFWMVETIRAMVLRTALLELAQDPGAQGDVVTPMVPPNYTGSSHNAWVRRHAEQQVLYVMQLVLNTVHARAGPPPLSYRNWTKIAAADPRRPHARLRLVVKEHMHSRRVMMRRMLYVNCLYFIMHRSKREDVTITMLQPMAEKPEVEDVDKSDYYAFTKSPTVSEDGVLSEGQTAAGGDLPKILTAPIVERGCLIRETRIVRTAYAGLYTAFTNDHLTFFVDVKRSLVLDEDYDWWAKTPQEYTATCSSCPGAWRLLFPIQGRS